MVATPNYILHTPLCLMLWHTHTHLHTRTNTHIYILSARTLMINNDNNGKVDNNSSTYEL